MQTQPLTFVETTFPAVIRAAEKPTRSSTVLYSVRGTDGVS